MYILHQLFPSSPSGQSFNSTSVMGQRFSQKMAKYFGKSSPEIRVGMLGLDGVGKTTILYYLKNNSLSEEMVVPTVGFNMETIQYAKYGLNIWDIGGSRPKSKVLWNHYNKNTKAIIYVIDAGDRERISMAMDELRSLWLQTESDTVFLVYANKQDLPDAISKESLERYMDMPNLNVRHLWIIQECCAITGLGLWEGIQKLLDLREELQKKSSLNRLRKS